MLGLAALMLHQLYIKSPGGRKSPCPSQPMWLLRNFSPFKFTLPKNVGEDEVSLPEGFSPETEEPRR